MKKQLFKFFAVFFIDDLFRFFRRKKTFFLLGILFLFLSGITQLGIPLVFGKSLGSMTNTKNLVYPELSSFALIFGMVLLQFSFMFVRDYFFMKFSLDGISNLKKYLFEKFLRLPMSYHNRNSVGGSMSILSSDIETVKNLYSSQLSKFLYNIFIVIVATIILLKINYKLSLILLFIFSLSISIAYVFGKRIRNIALETQTLNFSLSSKFEESLNKVKTIKIFTAEKFETDESNRKIDAVFLKLKKNEIMRSILSLVGLFTIMGALLFMVWYASYMIVRGEITVEDTVPIIINMLFIIYSISGISKFLANLEKARGTTMRLVDVLNSNVEPLLDNRKFEITAFKENISIKNSGLKYENSKDPVLSNININISKGEKVAIIGKNGSGKSSLINMLLQLYIPYNGTIFLDDNNIDEINLESYRRLFSVVSQDISLFNISIDKNICYPDTAVDEKRLSYVKELANIDFNLEDSDSIGSNGNLLSGGQRQKISLARALYRNSDILILDEVTNSLDRNTRSFLNSECFQNYLSTKTVIYISHDMSLINKVDKVIVLDYGKIVEIGTHKDLKFDNINYFKVTNDEQFKFQTS